jgi:nucleoside-diphosphate-sugar epimerase
MTPWRQLHGSSFENTTSLVTGGAGFIGSHISEALIALGGRVIVLDDLSGGEEANLDTFRPADAARLRFVKGSILDTDLLRQVTAGCRFVFHQAALGSVPRSVEQPVRYTQVNILGTQNVLEAAREARVQRVMFAASSSAYGDSETLPKIESMPVLPKSPYAATKVADEALMRAYSDSYGLDTACLRYFNIFGPRQNANSAYAAVIAAFAKALIEQDAAPTIHGDGEQSRDFTFVHNAVHANLLAARSAKPIGGQVINVACGTRVTVNQLCTLMMQMLGKPHLKPQYVPTRAGDVKHSLADLAVARHVLGYQPIVDFETGLRPTVAWYQQDMQPAR